MDTARFALVLAVYTGEFLLSRKVRVSTAPRQKTRCLSNGSYGPTVEIPAIRLTGGSVRNAVFAHRHSKRLLRKKAAAESETHFQIALPIRLTNTEVPGLMVGGHLDPPP